MKSEKLCSIQSYFIFRLLTVAIALGSIVSVSVALAAYKPPPKQKRPSSYSITAGSRGGCEGIEAIPITVLAPKAHVGQTISTHPTFVWFVPKTSESLPVEFRLSEFDAEHKPTIKLSKPIILNRPSGIAMYVWSKDKPDLKVNKTYLWEVRIRCDRNRPSEDLYSRAEFQVVSRGLNQTGTSFSAINAIDRVQVYAEVGLWYDAIAKALKLSPQSKLGREGSKLLQQLASIEEAQLEKIATENKEDEDKFVRALQQWLKASQHIIEREL